MSVATPSITTSEQPVIVSTDVIWRFSVDQYHAMIQAGILTEDDPVELLEGWLVTKCPRTLDIVLSLNWPVILSLPFFPPAGTLIPKNRYY